MHLVLRLIWVFQPATYPLVYPYNNAKDMGTLFEPDLEAIFNFEPDVIIIGTRQQDYYEQLTEIAPTMFVDLRPEAFMEDFKQNTQNIASILGLSNKADDHINEIDATIEYLKLKADNSKRKHLLFLPTMAILVFMARFTFWSDS